MTATKSSSPEEATEGKAGPQKCTTRDVIEKLRKDVTEAQLQKEIFSQTVTALEEHLKQLEAYDDKISTAGDEYGQGIDTVCKDFADLRTVVEESKSQFECLVPEDGRKTIADVLDKLRRRREMLKTCIWELSRQVRDKQCELEHGKAKVAREEKRLDETLARLDNLKTELTDLKEIKESIDCSDKVSNVCRYAYYLDLVARLEIKCPTADEYMCELVEQVKKLDKTRQRVREIENDVRVLQDLLARVTKLRDDLVSAWSAELCRMVTAGTVSPLPADIAKACATDAKPVEQTGTATTPSGEEKPDEYPEQKEPDKPDDDYETTTEAEQKEKGA